MATMTEPKVGKQTLVHCLVEGGVAIIELDDPPANTYTHDMMRQLDEAILQARFDDTVHVLVLRGHGEKFFSAGANIAYLNSITPRYKYFFCLHANETLNRLEHTPKLTIAAHGVPVERGDRELGGVLQAVQGLVRVQAEEILVARGDAVQVRDVRASREKLLAVAAQHQHVHGVVEAGLQDRLVELAHHVVGVGVRGRVVELDDRDTALDQAVDERLLPDLGFRHRCHGTSASVYRGTRFGEAAAEDPRDETRQALGVDLARRVVPVVDPVHHAEQHVGGGAPIHRRLVRRHVLEQALQEVHIAPLDGAHFALALTREGVRLVGQDLHLGHVRGEKGDVVADERVQPLERVRVGQSRQRTLGAGQHARETTILDAVQQLLLAPHVVVHPGERHAGRRREVPHRGGVVALVGEHLRRSGEELVQPLVVGPHGFERSFEPMRPYDERLDQFLSRAAKVFADQGYHSTTMRDLAAASGMSLAGMYYYVKGKEELLYRIQEPCFTRVLEEAEHAVAGLTDPLARLQAFIRHHVNFFAAHMPEMKVLSHEATSLGG